ncbi:MAG: HRDC domain-containing protein [Gemmatimonadales bacterium]
MFNLAPGYAHFNYGHWMPAEPALITTDDAFAAFIARAAKYPRVALDTEAASFHRYVDRVYLVQASSDDETAIVDPLAVRDLSALGALLANPAVEVIFHDADYDLRMLDRDYGFRARNVWDTRIAAQLAGEKAFGLGSLLEKYYGLKLSKAYQRADWSERPLTEGMLAYAAADTTHLPGLRDLLADRLTGLGRLAWAQEEFVRLESLRWSVPNDEDPALRLKGAKLLKGPQLAVLKTVWQWRDDTARALDRATFRVLSNEAILGLAKTQPTDEAGLRAAGVPAPIARRSGTDLLGAVRQGLAMPRAEWPTWERQRRAKDEPVVDERFARLKALRATRSTAVDLDPGQVCPNGTLLAIARAAPTSAADLDVIPDLRSWQREVMGDAAMLAAVTGP